MKVTSNACLRREAPPPIGIAAEEDQYRPSSALEQFRHRDPESGAAIAQRRGDGETAASVRTCRERGRDALAVKQATNVIGNGAANRG